MQTNYLPQAPHHFYSATVILTGTREEFIELRNFLEASELRETRYSKIMDDVLEELDETIRFLSLIETN